MAPMDVSAETFQLKPFPWYLAFKLANHQAKNGCLGPIHRRTTHHRAHDLDMLDGIGIDVMGIVGEDHEVSQFARRDTALYVFLEGGVGAVHGADFQGLIECDALVRAPDPAREILASYHTL